jgi:predicted dehydrogenase
MSVHKPVRFGLIGPGNFADKWRIPALQQDTGGQLWSVLGQNHDRTLAFAQRHNALSSQPAHTDLDAFLQDPELDAVIVASPDRLHARHAIAAAHAGKHLLVEKPLAACYDDAIDILDACSDAGIKLATGYHLRWHAGHQLLAQGISCGALGELKSMRIQWTYKADAAEKDTTRQLTRWWCLSAVGTHAIDLAIWLMSPTCGKVVDIRCCHQTSNKPRAQAEQAEVEIRFESNAVATICVSVSERRPRLIEIHGTRSQAICLDTLGPLGAGKITVGDQELPYTPVNPYRAELVSLVQSINNGTPLLSDGGVGLNNVGWLERISH